MDIKQDTFYLNTESNAFFQRWKKLNDFKTNIRPIKLEIYDNLKTNINLDSIMVLEIGCFIGDLLSYLEKNHTCNVYGIEPSKDACVFSKKKLNLNLENNTFINSSLFNNSQDNLMKYDLIVLDDVLSWMSRDIILSTIGAIDWLLKPQGHIYLKDFTPHFSYATENHHWKGKNIYNFKQSSGHKNFFLNSGKYLEIFNKSRLSEKYQLKKSVRKDSLLWSDTILEKANNENFYHPKINIYK